MSPPASLEPRTVQDVSYRSGNPSLDPRPTPIGARETFYHLVNIDERPEVLPLALDLVTEHFSGASRSFEHLPEGLELLEHDPTSLDQLLDTLASWSSRYLKPWECCGEDLVRQQILHWYLQYIPTALVDGCWLQCATRVSTAHTPVGARLTLLYALHVGALLEDPVRQFVEDYRAVHERLRSPLEEVSSRSLVEREDILDAAFALPNVLLSVAQFPRSRLPEIVGLNLAWQYLGPSSFGPTLVREVCHHYALTPLGNDLRTPESVEKARALARDAAANLIEQPAGDTVANTWSRLWNGVVTGALAWASWFDDTRRSAPQGPSDPAAAMIDMLRKKAPYARGYHAEKSLGDKRIDDHLDPHAFDGPALLDDLVRSPWVKPGNSEESQLVRGLVEFGGPMHSVFSQAEIETMKRWIDSLPEDLTAGCSGEGDHSPAADRPADASNAIEDRRPTTNGTASRRLRPLWTAETFRRRSQRRYQGQSVRDLYYHLVNVEHYPDVLPLAERFALDRLERSRATLGWGDRQIPSTHYDPDALERWVWAKHREQVDSYRPPDRRPSVRESTFIETTVQLAPVILIDGGWLQGVASPPLIHTVIGRMLFHVFIEEVGEGDQHKHHANIYRDLLVAMGENAPPVESRAFAHWHRLRDASFDVPTLWLSISCFPRHFLPEILGLNLAVEIAGVGGPYMEARDTLKEFGYPTLFVDVHNAADNVACGHAAWAVSTIRRYMDELAEREGPHSLDGAWQRVWTGVRSTLPQIGRLRLIAHRVKQRVLGLEDGGRVSPIFHL